jgi:hypothetical protein
MHAAEKSICGGCVYSFCVSGTDGKKCPFCKSDQGNADDENNDNAEE